MRLILAILLIATFSFGKTYKDQLNGLNEFQRETLVSSLRAGKMFKNKEHGIILAAIAWKESNLGMRKINDKDGKHGSWGAHQILLDSALKRLKDLEKVVGKNNIAKILYYSDTFSAAMATKELTYWSKVHKGDLEKTLASYNAGWKSTESSRGLKYAKDVQYRAKLIAEYIEANNIAV